MLKDRTILHYTGQVATLDAICWQATSKQKQWSGRCGRNAEGAPTQRETQMNTDARKHHMHAYTYTHTNACVALSSSPWSSSSLANVLDFSSQGAVQQLINELRWTTCLHSFSWVMSCKAFSTNGMQIKPIPAATGLLALSNHSRNGWRRGWERMCCFWGHHKTGGISRSSASHSSTFTLHFCAFLGRESYWGRNEKERTAKSQGSTVCEFLLLLCCKFSGSCRK